MACLIHLDHLEGVCPDCGMKVDSYGNTEDDFRYCCFPDCGCDGARLCMAPEGPSERAAGGNVEGMWTGRTVGQRRAAMELMQEVNKK